MSNLVFGAFWTAFMSFFTFMFYADTGGTITVNDTVVSQEEFNAMLGPKIFFGIFWAIGLFLIISGIKEIIKNYYTEQYGEVCYGKIINVFNSGTYINGVPELKATISIYLESTGEVDEITEIIGLANKTKYNVGDYIEGKYYNNDINIISQVSENMIPSYILPMLKDIDVNEYNEDTIIIDGIEYIRKNSLKY